MGDIDGLLVGKNRGFDITCLPHMGEIEMVRDQIPTSAPPTPYWGGVGLDIDSCITCMPETRVAINSGPEDPGTRGPGDPRTRGPEDPRTRGPRTRGPEDPRTEDPRIRGPEDPRTEDPRTRGPEDQGPEDIITEGCFALQQLPIDRVPAWAWSVYFRILTAIL